MKKVAVSIHAIENFDPDIIKYLEGLDYIHLDMMDGKFVKTKNINWNAFKIVKENYDIPTIAHLMVDEPIKYFNRIIDYTDFFVFHYESRGKIEELIEKIKINKKKIGIALNPDTPLTKIVPFLNDIDLILIMSVVPGWSGQDFIWESIDKVDLLVAYRAYMNMGYLIDIDGGVNLKNVGFINSDIVSSSSAILKAKNPNLVIQKLKEIKYHD